MLEVAPPRFWNFFFCWWVKQYTATLINMTGRKRELHMKWDYRGEFFLNNPFDVNYLVGLKGWAAGILTSSETRPLKVFSSHVLRVVSEKAHESSVSKVIEVLFWQQDKLQSYIGYLSDIIKWLHFLSVNVVIEMTHVLWIRIRWSWQVSAREYHLSDFGPAVQGHGWQCHGSCHG